MKAPVPIWNRLSYEDRQTVRAAVLWTILGWLVVPAKEFGALVHGSEWGIFPYLQRGLLSFVFVLTVLHFRDKYLRAKAVAEAAEWIASAGRYESDREGRTVYVSRLREMSHLHGALDRWKGWVSQKSETVQDAYAAEKLSSSEGLK